MAYILKDSTQGQVSVKLTDAGRKKLSEGKNEKEVYEFLKSKYGDWIVYEPDLNFKTIFLWLIPLILFVFGGFLIFRKRFIN